MLHAAWQHECDVAVFKGLGCPEVLVFCRTWCWCLFWSGSGGATGQVRLQNPSCTKAGEMKHRAGHRSEPRGSILYVT